MERVTFEIDWVELTPANRWYKDRWAKARHVAEWREAALQAAQINKLPKDWASMGVVAQARYEAGQLTDPDAFAPAMKAVVDGLTFGPKPPHGYGVIPDDHGAHYRGLLLLPPFKDPTKRSALIVTLIEGDPWSSIP